MRLDTLSDREIIVTLLALAMLLAGAFFMGRLFEKIQAPKVVGEIIGGMLFGGTVLGYFMPRFTEAVFFAYTEEGKVLNIFYQMGLCFLMFSSGYNTRIDLKKENGKILGALFVGSTLIPMLLGLVFVSYFESFFIGTAGSHVAFLLTFLIGIAITSIPVISKIFFDMGVMNTRFANIVLTASTLQDLCLWVLLNTAIEIAQSQRVNIGSMLLIVAVTLLLFGFVKLFGGWLEKRYFKVSGTSFMQQCFICLFLMVALLSLLKINIMYSSFLVGYLIHSATMSENTAQGKVENISEFSFTFFVPVYFALVGIQLNLLNNFSLFHFFAFFVMAFLLEGLGTIITLRFATSLRGNVIANFGITMNARGGPGIVLATVGYNYGIINVEFFTVLILTTMLSSTIAGYWLRMQQKKNNNIFNNLEE